jgi:hypothetical protein
MGGQSKLVPEPHWEKNLKKNHLFGPHFGDNRGKSCNISKNTDFRSEFGTAALVQRTKIQVRFFSNFEKFYWYINQKDPKLHRNYENMSLHE